MYRRSEPNENVFVQGIPLDLDRDGLMNIFCRAGPIEEARIIAPKDPTHKNTYGFVKFKHKTAASRAIDLFSDYKIANSYLRVSYCISQQQEKNESTCNQAVYKSNTSLILNEDDDDWEPVNKKTIPPSNRRSINPATTTNEKIKKLNPLFNYDISKPFDMTKPFARRLVELYLRKTSPDMIGCKVKTQAVETPEYVSPAPKEKPQIGQIYLVSITHVHTPSNFFVQLLSTVETTANVLNNLTNHYENKFPDDSNNGNLNVDDLCAAFIEGWWHRARITHKSNNTYTIYLIDFGDTYELSFNLVRKLNKEFSAAPKGSIRCKLHNLRPNQKDWSNQAIDYIKGLIKFQDPLYIKIEEIDEFERVEGRFEDIYSVSLFDSDFPEDTVNAYLIEKKLAIEVTSQENLNGINLFYPIDYLNNISNQSEENKANNLNSTLHTSNSEDLSNLTVTDIDSVSVQDYNSNNLKRLEEHNKAIRSLQCDPNQRNSFFIGGFPIWKKRDLAKPTQQTFKCGQKFEVKISHVKYSKEFYVHTLDQRKKLEKFEIELQNYATVLIKKEEEVKDKSLGNLLAFQELITKFDLVLVKAEKGKWKRAIYLDRITQQSFLDQITSEEESILIQNDKTYYSFCLIDWGMEHLIVRAKNEKNLFVLPIDVKLVQVGAFALKCSIDQTKLKTRLLYGLTDIKSDDERVKFEMLFKKLTNNKDKEMIIRISHFMNALSGNQSQSEAIVELFCKPNDKDLKDFDKNQDEYKYLTSQELNSRLNLVNLIMNANDIEIYAQINPVIKNNGSINVKTEELSAEEKSKTTSLAMNSDYISTSSQPQLDSEKLIKGTYQVVLQYFDDTYNDDYFYVALSENLDKLDELDLKLQEQSLSPEEEARKYTYLTKFSDLKIGLVCEALYDLDSKWYRVCVRSINLKESKFSIYYLDYGNSQTLNNMHLNNKILRKRNYYETQNELKIFSLKYQAIKCKYAQLNGNSVKFESFKNFNDKLLENNYEDDFEIKIVSVSEDYDSDMFEMNRICHGIDLAFSSKTKPIPQTKSDNEVNTIMAKPVEQASLKPKSANPNEIENNSLHDLKSYNLKHKFNNPSLYLDFKTNDMISVIFTNSENTNEFYVHSEDDLKKLARLSTLIKTYLSSVSIPSEFSPNGGPQYQPGDFIFANQSGSEWRRAIVLESSLNKFALTRSNNSPNSLGEEDINLLSASISSSLNLSESKLNKATDGYIYTVYYVDMGQQESFVTSKNMLPIKSILNHNSNTKLSQQDLTKLIIEQPFLAICCQMDSNLIKHNETNSEMLKSFVKSYLNFSIKIKSVSSHNLFSANYNGQQKKLSETNDDDLKLFNIKKYVVSLYTDDELLDEKLEQIKCLDLNNNITINSLPPKPPTQAISKQPSATLSRTTTPLLNLNEIKLEKNRYYECKMAYLGDMGEIYVYLVSNLNKLIELEEKIKEFQNSNFKCSTTNWQPNYGDLVLAKYYSSETDFNWYRALIINFDPQTNQYEVFFIDYGNVESKLTKNDLIELPTELDLNKYQIMSHHVQLRNVKFDVNNDDQFKLVENIEYCYVKILCDSTNLDKKKMILYDCEIWSMDHRECLNKLIDQKYETQPDEIATTNLTSLFQKSKERPMRVNTKYTYVEQLTRSLSFVLESDLPMRSKLTDKLNAYYKSKELAKHTIRIDPRKFEIGDYFACISNESWYRVKITDIAKESLTVFFIDYGYDEILSYDKIDVRLRNLNPKFLQKPTYCFQAQLYDKKNAIKFQFDQDDNNKYIDVIEEFFSDSTDNLTIDIYNLNENIFEIELFNPKKLSLNEMILEEKERLLNKKEPRPDLIRLTLSDMPKQSILDENEFYMMYTQLFEQFYLFSEKKVDHIQHKLQDICAKILLDEEKLEFNNSIDLPKKGDLCFGKYETDANWYRCLITNCDHPRNNYEIFFVDFGNVENVSRDEILYGFRSEHVQIFKQEQAQAYKCKLFDLIPVGNQDELNAKFADTFNNKMFKVNLIHSNNDNLNEVELNEIDLDDSNKLVCNVHKTLIEQENLVDFPQLSQILKRKNTTTKQNSFYMSLFQNWTKL